MPSDKRLKDLEYNVFRKDMDNKSSDNIIGTNDKGCLTLLGTILVFIVVVVCIIGFTQVGKNGPALTCAAPGCSNRLKPGSNYCWLHSSSSTGSRKSGGGSASSSSSSGSGSVIGGSSSASEPKKRNKIWNGEGNNKSNKSSSSSSSSSGGSSSGSGSGIGN